MDREVKKAMQHARDRERAVWNRVEEAGRNARAADAAKAGATVKADEDQKKRARAAPTQSA